MTPAEAEAAIGKLTYPEMMLLMATKLRYEGWKRQAEATLVELIELLESMDTDATDSVLTTAKNDLATLRG